MSNEPVRKVASFDESVVLPAPGARPDSPRLDPTPDHIMDPLADAELVLAAMRRIELALRNDHATPPLARLRERLGHIAGDIAEARLAVALDDEYGARSVDIGALLERLEQRVTGMLAIANEPPAAAQETAPEISPEPERVPTVGEVVSRMNLPDDTIDDRATASPDIFSRAPSVAMLEAMVEALTAAPAPPALEPDTTPPAPEGPAFEDDLLADFALIDSMPFMPDEIGTAVIFDTATGLEIEPRAGSDAADAGDTTDAIAVAAPAVTPFALAVAAVSGCAIVVTRDARPLALAPTPVIADATPAPVAEPAPARFEPVLRPDPLAPLRMRSTVETIALFS